MIIKIFEGINADTDYKSFCCDVHNIIARFETNLPNTVNRVITVYYDDDDDE